MDEGKVGSVVWWLNAQMGCAGRFISEGKKLRSDVVSSGRGGGRNRQVNSANAINLRWAWIRESRQCDVVIGQTAIMSWRLMWSRIAMTTAAVFAGLRLR